MKFSQSRRFFGAKAAVAMSAIFTSSHALSLKNPGRDRAEVRYIGDKTKHYVMVMDLRKCVGCQGCTSACKAENNVPKGDFRTYVGEYEIGDFPDVRKAFLPQLCNHCENPSCVSVCPTGATFKREDGIVVVDNTICWGCGYCINACPYDKRYYNSDTKVADKCTFCAHRLDEGLLPACVETCVGGARVFGDLNDTNSEVYKLLKQFPHQVLNKAAGTNPQVFYIGLNNELQGQIDGLPSLQDYVKSMDLNTHKEWQIKGV